MERHKVGGFVRDNHPPHRCSPAEVNAFFYRMSLTAAALDDNLASPKVQDRSVDCWSRPSRKETANNAQEGAKWGGLFLDNREAVAERSAVPRAQDLPQESACREPGQQAGASRSQGSAGGTPWRNLTRRGCRNSRGRRPSSRDGRGRDPNHWGGRGRGGLFTLIDRVASRAKAIGHPRCVASRSQLWGSLEKRSKFGKKLAELQ